MCSLQPLPKPPPLIVTNFSAFYRKFQLIEVITTSMPSFITLINQQGVECEFCFSESNRCYHRIGFHYKVVQLARQMICRCFGRNKKAAFHIKWSNKPSIVILSQVTSNKCSSTISSETNTKSGHIFHRLFAVRALRTIREQ